MRNLLPETRELFGLLGPVHAIGLWYSHTVPSVGTKASQRITETERSQLGSPGLSRLDLGILQPGRRVWPRDRFCFPEASGQEGGGAFQPHHGPEPALAFGR